MLWRMAMLAAILLLVLRGRACQQQAEADLHRYAWTRVRTPLPLIEGAKIRRAFKTETTETCYLELEFEKANPELGSILRRSRYDGIRKDDEVLVHWQVQTGERVVAEGDVRGNHLGWGGGAMSPRIGRFEGIEGRSYHLSAVVTRSVPELCDTDALLQISIERGPYKAIGVGASVDPFFGMVLYGIAATVCLLWILLEVRRFVTVGRPESGIPDAGRPGENE